MTDKPADMGKDGKAYKLTLKQEGAAQALFEHDGNQSAAYRAYYDTEGMQDSTIHEEACRLFATPKVAARVKELQEAHSKRHRVSRDSLTAQLSEDRALARDRGQTGAAVQATMGQAKLHGFLVDKHLDVTPLEQMTDAELETEIARLDHEIEQEKAAQRIAEQPSETLPASKLTH